MRVKTVDLFSHEGLDKSFLDLQKKTRNLLKIT
jgi:hypothetical protein